MSNRLRLLRSYGLKKARDLFLNQAYTVPTMRDFYQDWRDEKLYMKGEKWIYSKENGKSVIDSEKTSWPLAKRGDDQYKEELREKLAWIDRLPSESVFDTSDRSKTVQKTNCLFITGTTQKYDRFYQNQEKHDIWKEQSAIDNRTMTRLKQHYGRIVYFRSNEGTKEGFPAPHAVLIFLDHTWNTRLMTSKGGKKHWRIFGDQFRELKDILEGKDSRASPVAGFVDIQGIFNPRSALKHISKYCFMSEFNPDGSPTRKGEIQDVTYFWLWITRKHTYTSSRDFKTNVQKFLKVNTDLTLGDKAISKDTWVYLQVCTPREAQEWDPYGLVYSKRIPWPRPDGSYYPPEPINEGFLK